MRRGGFSRYCILSELVVAAALHTFLESWLYPSSFANQLQGTVDSVGTPPCLVLKLLYL